MKYPMPRWLVARFSGKPTIAPVQLRAWHIVAALVLAIQAVAILLLSGTYLLPMYVSFLTGNSLQSKLSGQTVQAPAVHELTQVNVAYVVAAMLLLTAVVYALLGTILRRRYEAWLKRKVQPMRWVVVAIAGIMMLCTLGLIAGLQQLDDVKLIAVLTIIASIGCWQLDLHGNHRGISPVAWAGLAMTLVAAIVPWLMIVFTLIAGNIFGSIPAAATTWWLAAVLFAVWLLFAANLHLHRFAIGKWANYLYAECWCIGLIVLAETVFAWLLFGTLLKP